MTVCSDITDYEWLTGDGACALLTDLAESTAPLHTVVTRLRGNLSLQRTHLLIEQVKLRRRAASKFSRAAQMFFTRLGLEQATDEWIAAHKAARFASLQAGASSPQGIADLCCGIGGDLSALSIRGAGIDRDPVAAHFAAKNSESPVRMADVADVDLAEFAAWHIDPDRRPTGRRTTSLNYCQPDIATIERLLASVPHAAIKLAPATQVPDSWTEQCELEWISRDRECRQLVAWHGDLAHAPGKRQATVLSAAGCSQPARTIVGQAKLAIPIAMRVDRYVLEIDAAVLAAHLKGALAAEHGLEALASGSTYLTGPLPIEDAALSCFEVADVLPLQPRKLAAHLRERSVGRLEIKKRGVEIEPDRLRHELKLRGENEAVLLITPVGGRNTAIVARRV